MTPVIYSFILLTSAFFFYVFKVIFHHGAEAHLIKKSFVVWCWRHYVALKCRRTYNYTCQCTHLGGMERRHVRNSAECFPTFKIEMFVI